MGVKSAAINKTGRSKITTSNGQNKKNKNERALARMGMCDEHDMVP